MPKRVHHGAARDPGINNRAVCRNDRPDDVMDRNLGWLVSLEEIKDKDRCVPGWVPVHGVSEMLCQIAVESDHRQP